MDRVPRSIHERSVFVDTSAFLAIVDRKDRYHIPAESASDKLLQYRYRLFTTTYVVVETHASVLRAISSRTGRQFLIDGLVGISLLPVTGEDEEQAKRLILAQADKDYSLCDAISFMVMERFGVRLAFAYDDHFRQRGFATPLDRHEWP